MPVAFRSIGPVEQVFGTTMEVTAPAGIVDGDLLIMHSTVSANTTTVTVDEPGWTKLIDANSSLGGSNTVSVHYKIANNESGTYTVGGLGASQSFRSVCAAYSGVDQTTPFDATTVETINVVDSDTHDANPITTVTNDGFVLNLLGLVQGATPGTQPAGYNKRAENGTSNYLGYADIAKAVAGVENPGPWSGLGSDADSTSVTIALRAAAAAGKTATVRLADINGVDRANLSQVPWAWYNGLPTTLETPSDTGTGATDASGNMTVDIPNSTLTSGQVGYLVIDTGAWQGIYAVTVS